MLTALRTSTRSSLEPAKCCGSVSTEIALAPALAYARACVAALSDGCIHPLDGERRFTSAMTDTVVPRRADANAGTDAPFLARSSSSAIRLSSARARTRASSTMRPSVPDGGVHGENACTSVLLRIS